MQALKRVKEKYRRQIDDLTSKIIKLDGNKIVNKDEEEENLDIKMSSSFNSKKNRKRT